MSQVSATGIAAGRTSTGDALTANLTRSVNVAGVESVTVGAGIFPNAVKVVTTTSGTLFDTPTAQSVPFTQTDTSWYAPGVGMVQETLTGVTDTTTLSQTWSARGYTVGGVAHGITAERTVTSGLGGGIVQAQAVRGDKNTLVLSKGLLGGYVGSLVGDNAVLQGSVSLLDPFGPSFLGFDGSNYVSVSYAPNPADNSFSGLTFRRITTAGLVIDQGTGLFVSSSAHILNPDVFAVGNSPGQTLVVFTQSEQVDSEHQHVFGLLVDSNGVPSSTTPFQITTTSNPKRGTISFDGTNYLLVWQAEISNLRPAVYATRISPSGVALDSQAVLLSSGVSDISAPALAYDGTNYLAAWVETDSNSQTTVWGRRMSPAGVLLDGPPNSGALQLSLSSSEVRVTPAIAFNGTEYLVAWLADSGIKGVRLGTTGTLTGGLGFEFKLSGTSNSGESLSATSGPTPQFMWIRLTNTDTVLINVAVNPF